MSSRVRRSTALGALTLAGALIAAPALAAPPGAAATPEPATGTAAPSAASRQALSLLPAGARLTRPPRFTDAARVLTASSLQALTGVTRAGTVRAAEPTAQLRALRPGDVLVAGPTRQAPSGLLRRVTGVARSPSGLVLTTAPAQLTDAVSSLAASYSGPAPAPATPTAATTTPARGVTVTQATSREFTVGLRDYVLYDIDGRASTSDDQMRADGTITFSVPRIDFAIDINQARITTLRFVTTFDTLRSNLTVHGKVPTKGIQREQVPFSLSLPAIPIGVLSVTPAVDVVVSVSGQTQPRGPLFFNKATVDMSWGTQFSLIDAAKPASAGFDYAAGAGITPVVALPQPGFTFTPVSLSGDEAVTQARLIGALGVRPKIYLYGLVGPYVLVAPAAGVQVDRYDPAAEATPFTLRAGVRLGGGVSVKLVNETNLGLAFNLTVPVYSGTGTA